MKTSTFCFGYLQNIFFPIYDRFGKRKLQPFVLDTHKTFFFLEEELPQYPAEYFSGELKYQIFYYSLYVTAFNSRLF